MQPRFIKILPATVVLFLCQISLAAGPDLSVAPAVRMHRENITGSNAKFTVNVTGRTPPVNQSIEITGPARDVKLKVEGGLDLSSMEAIFNSITTPGMTDEEKAKACFYFVGRNFYDRGGSGCEDPLEYVNLWGFSWCGNFGLFLNALWREAGFPTVFLNPVIGMPGGHTISAVYYDNQWHMFDSRMRGYFVKRDNRTVASLVDLDRDDDLIRRGLDYSNLALGRWGFALTMQNYSNGASDWYDGYNAHFDNKTLFHTNTPPWDPRLDIRTGEKLTLTWEKKGKWWNRKELSPEWMKLHNIHFSSAAKEPPMLYANGTLEFRPDPARFKSQAEQSSGIRAAGGKTPQFMPVSAGKTGYVIYKVRVPYFIPSMQFEATGYRKTDTDYLAAELSADEGKTWLPIWKAEGTGQIKASVSTEQTQLVTMYKKNKYSYLLRFSMKASGSASDVSLGEIRVVTDLYYRPMSLPALHNRANEIIYSDRTKGSHSRQVTFHWLEETNILFSEDKPCEGDRITITALVENRGDEPARNVAVRFFDGDPAAGGVQISEEVLIPSIEPGATARAEVSWRAVKRLNGESSVHTYGQIINPRGYTHNTIFVQVDPENILAETNEHNNTTSRELVVYNMANLVLGHPSFVEFDHRGDKVLITAFVRNHNMAGPRPRVREARNVVVRFYDRQPIIGRMKQFMIGEAVIPAIDPGEWGIARVEWDVAGLSGPQRVYVVVDPEDEIPESWQRRPGEYMLIKKEINL